MYRLADGFIFSFAADGVQVVDFRSREVQELGAVSADWIAQLALGRYPRAWTPAEPEALKELIVPGGLQVDPVIEARLRQLDWLFLASYWTHLTQREQSAYEQILAAHCMRKRILAGYCQLPVLPETTLRRALLIGDAERVGRKKIVCVGDDDLTSIGLAALGHEVLVFDVDTYLVELISLLAARSGLDVKVQPVDLHEALPERYVGEFDCFLADPVSNSLCLRLFLSRGLSMLKPKGRGYVAACVRATALHEELAGEMQLQVARWLRRYNRYYQSGVLDLYESDWLELERGVGSAPTYAPSERVPVTPETYVASDASDTVLMQCYVGFPQASSGGQEMLGELLSGLDERSAEGARAHAGSQGTTWASHQITTVAGFVSCLADENSESVFLVKYPAARGDHARARRALLALEAGRSRGRRSAAGRRLQWSKREIPRWRWMSGSH